MGMTKNSKQDVNSFIAYINGNGLAASSSSSSTSTSLINGNKTTPTTTTTTSTSTGTVNMKSGGVVSHHALTMFSNVVTLVSIMAVAAAMF